MDNLKDFRKSALIIIYPDGTVKNVLINQKVIHLMYYVNLYNNDEYFKKIVDENNIHVPNDFFESKMILTYEIDKALAKIGVVVFHNLFMFEIIKDEDFIKNTPPQFYVSLPNELTNEQKAVINRLYRDYDMSYNLYSKYAKSLIISSDSNHEFSEDELVDISYDEFENMVESQNKRK